MGVHTISGSEFVWSAFIGGRETAPSSSLVSDRVDPMQGVYIERFHGKFRDKYLNERAMVETLL